MIKLIKSVSNDRYYFPSILFNPRRCSLKVMFDKSCKENIYEYRKIFGLNYFSFQENSITFTWKYNRFHETIDIYCKNTLNNKTNYTLIAQVDFLKECELVIKIVEDDYILNVFQITSTTKLLIDTLTIENKHKSKLILLK